mgnify:CR=1 FL=1
MLFTTNSLFGRAARATAATFVLLSALVAGSVSASAQARVDNGRHLGWNKNGKAADKAERKAERQAARDAQRPTTVIVTPNSQVVDRSRTRSSANKYPYYGNNGSYRNNGYYGNNNRYGWTGPIVFDANTGRIYRQNNGSRCEYPNYNGSYGYYNGASYNNYGYNPYGYNSANYGYGNYAYYNNGRGDLSPNEVAERASRSGYYAGFQRGAYDGSRGFRPNPQGHGAFQFGYDGFDPEWGSAQTYQQTYRQYFIQGYNDGFSRNRYNDRYRVRY